MDCWSPSLAVDDEFHKLALEVNPPRITVDNGSNREATLIKVDGASKNGSLLEVVQVLNDLNLVIRRAYISFDGEWFSDVFHVTDQRGNTLFDDRIAERIQPSLGPRPPSFCALRSSVGDHAASESKQTTIELTGRDRAGLLSEIFAVLVELRCNVVSGEVWTHNSRMALVLYITDDETGKPIDDPSRLSEIKEFLLKVLMADKDMCTANPALFVGSTHTESLERKLHQMMYADRDYDLHSADSGSASDRHKPFVTVEQYADKEYTVVNLRCPDRPKLLFDAVCSLTDMQYVVYHATVIAKGPEAYQEYYIRRTDHRPISSEEEKLRVVHCLEAAICRRTSEGIRLELRTGDRAGLLSGVTRIFRENSLSVTGRQGDPKQWMFST